jgi:hypothetical protein
MDLVDDVSNDNSDVVSNRHSLITKQNEVIEDDFLLPAPPLIDNTGNMIDLEKALSNLNDFKESRKSITNIAPTYLLKRLKEIYDLFNNDNNKDEVYWVSGDVIAVAKINSKNDKFDVSVRFDDTHDILDIKLSPILVEKTLGVSVTEYNVAKTKLSKVAFKDYKNELFTRLSVLQGYFAVHRSNDSLQQIEIFLEANELDILNLSKMLVDTNA